MVVFWSVVTALTTTGVLAAFKLSAGHLWDRYHAAAAVRIVEQDMASSSWVLPYSINLDPAIGTDWRPPGAVPLAAAGAGACARTFSFELTSKLRKPAVITSIRAVIDSAAPTPSGTLFFAPPQGSTDKGPIGFDLMSSDLNARLMINGFVADQHYIGEKTTTLDSGETTGFKVTVRATRNVDIHYHLSISFSRGKDVVVDDGGRSFRITTYPETAQIAYTITRPSAGYDFGAYQCSWPDGCYLSFFNVRTD